MMALRWFGLASVVIGCCGCCEVFGIGCPPPVGVEFTVQIHNNCPGNAEQADVGYLIDYIAEPDGQKEVTGSVASGGVESLDFTGRDSNGDGALDVFDLYLDYLDADEEYLEFHSHIDDGVVVTGTILKYTLNNGCVTSLEIVPPTGGTNGATSKQTAKPASGKSGSSVLEQTGRAVRSVLPGNCCR